MPIGTSQSSSWAKHFGRPGSLKREGHEVTSADGIDVYNLELELEVVPSGVVPDPFKRQGVDANRFQAGAFRRLNLLACRRSSYGSERSPGPDHDNPKQQMARGGRSSFCRPDAEPANRVTLDRSREDPEIVGQELGIVSG